MNLEHMFGGDNGFVVGHAYWGIYHEKAYGYSIYIKEDFRRLGLGHQLMNHLEKDASENGFNILTLSTLKTNAANLFFNHQHYEFEKEDVQGHYYFKKLTSDE